jgi:hypothetical protein
MRLQLTKELIMLDSKLRGLIAMDIVLSLSPLMIGVAPELVNWISYIFITLTLLIIVTLIFSKEDSDGLKKIEIEHRARPRWWNFYDLMSDVIFVAMWAMYGFYIVVFVLVIMKVFISIKIPNYYKGV